MKFYDVKQNSDEWFDLRAGKITSSKWSTVMANYGKAFGDPAKNYAQRIALERFSGNRIDENVYIKDAERGHEFEPIARDLYEMETFSVVTNGGFYVEGNVGDSNDGNVGEEGCIEIKTVRYSTHFTTLRKDAVPTAYKWQNQGHIWTGNKKWCDFVELCPEFPEEKRLFVRRVERDEEMIEMMKLRLAEFEELIEENIKLLKDKQ